MKQPPTVDQVKRTIAELPRDERVELTQWMLQRYIAGGAFESDDGSDPQSSQAVQEGPRATG